MEGILSLFGSRNDCYEASDSEACKERQLQLNVLEDDKRLIPGLPDDISCRILARLPKIHYLKAKLVSRAWKEIITSAELLNLRKELGTTEEWLYILIRDKENKLLWYALDPLSRRWQRLPQMPPIPENAFEDDSRKGLSSWNLLDSEWIPDDTKDWRERKEGLLNQVSFRGFAFEAIDRFLYVIGGMCRDSELNRVCRYDPVSNSWSQVSPMLKARAYSKTCILDNKLYVVGGLTKIPGDINALPSAEVFDPHTGIWSEIPSIPFSIAQRTTSLFKPIVTGVTSYMGKIFVRQSLHSLPLLVDIGGEVYDPKANSWGEMPVGMRLGWPLKAAACKSTVLLDGKLYALDPAESSNDAAIKVYDYQNDAWIVLIKGVPVYYDINNSMAWFLLTALLGKLHVITKDADGHCCKESWIDRTGWLSGNECLVLTKCLSIIHFGGRTNGSKIVASKHHHHDSFKVLLLFRYV